MSRPRNKNDAGGWGRLSAGRMPKAVRRLPRGEDLDASSREPGGTAAKRSVRRTSILDGVDGMRVSTNEPALFPSPAMIGVVSRDGGG